MKWRMNSKGKAKCFSFSIYALSLQEAFYNIFREKCNSYYGIILKEDSIMITFLLTIIALIIAIVVAAVFIFVGGAGFFVVFGDVIVCGLLIFLIVRHIVKRM